jgi:hypothetical protein
MPSTGPCFARHAAHQLCTPSGCSSVTRSSLAPKLSAGWNTCSLVALCFEQFGHDLSLPLSRVWLRLSGFPQCVQLIGPPGQRTDGTCRIKPP